MTIGFFPLFQDQCQALRRLPFIAYQYYLQPTRYIQSANTSNDSHTQMSRWCRSIKQRPLQPKLTDAYAFIIIYIITRIYIQ